MSDNRPTVRITATIGKEQEQVLKSLSAKHKVSVAWLIRHAVDRLTREGEAIQLPLDLGNSPGGGSMR